MNKIILIISLSIILVGCEDFLDSAPTNLKTTDNYPSTPDEANQVLIGIYSILSHSDPLQSSFMIGELRSDERLGGGGPSDIAVKAISQYQKWNESCFATAWKSNYKGIFRANTLLEGLDRVKWKESSQKDQMEGEARFLRAHYYFDLSRMFGDVCLIQSSSAINVPRSPAADTYSLIASDLKTAIEKLPVVKYNQVQSGRITKWAAQALMARVFLFYTGYYKKQTLPLPNGDAITKEVVIDWLDECSNSAISGHDLVSDFRNLWPYSYVSDYLFTKDNNLQWEGDGNKESVFAIKYSNSFANWEYPYQESNQVCLYFGLRGQENYVLTFPFGQGWGFGTVNPKIWNDWDDNDLRKKGSMFDATDRKELQRYQFGKDSQVEDTKYYQKKYMPINVYTDASKSTVWNYSRKLYGNTVDNYMLNNTQDLVLIRFSDVLLMAAELNIGTSKAQVFLDRVRGRVGLSSIPATLDNIKAERRFELAFEGIRFYDLLRWNDAEQVLNDNQKDIVIYLDKNTTTTKTITYRSQTNGFLQIPQSEIELSKGVLTLNPGWGTDAEYRTNAQQ